METSISEIADGIYRLSTFVPDIAPPVGFTFNQFLILGDEPFMFHTGLRKMFPLNRDAVSRLIPPERLRWIAFSHFEADECGAMNEWLAIAPQATPAHGQTGVAVSLNDFADRTPRVLTNGEVVDLGGKRIRFIDTPHTPHGWDAGVLFEETDKTLLCSDLFHQNGDVVALTDKDILEAHKRSLLFYESGPLIDYTPYSHKTKAMLYELASLNPKTLATMHGSSFFGDCSKALTELNEVMKEVWGEKLVNVNKNEVFRV